MQFISTLYRVLIRYYYILFKDRVQYARFLGVKVGKNCRFYINYFGTEPFLISIGNHVTIASDVKLITHDGSAILFNDNNGRRYIYKPITIGNNIFIGMNSIILPGVNIEDNVIIGAGSVVTKSIPSDSIVAGNPAKLTGKYSELRQLALDTYITADNLKEAPYQMIVEKYSVKIPKAFLKL